MRRCQIGYDMSTLIVQHVYLAMDLLHANDTRMLDDARIFYLSLLLGYFQVALLSDWARALLPSFLTPFHGAMNAGSRAHRFSSITSPWTWLSG